eukprot:scaffold7958_cov25-Tisochrysis_lutea.AAC.1
MLGLVFYARLHTCAMWRLQLDGRLAGSAFTLGRAFAVRICGFRAKRLAVGAIRPSQSHPAHLLADA